MKAFTSAWGTNPFPERGGQLHGHAAASERVSPANAELTALVPSLACRFVGFNYSSARIWLNYQECVRACVLGGVGCGLGGREEGLALVAACLWHVLMHARSQVEPGSTQTTAFAVLRGATTRALGCPASRHACRMQY